MTEISIKSKNRVNQILKFVILDNSLAKIGNKI